MNGIPPQWSMTGYWLGRRCCRKDYCRPIGLFEEAAHSRPPPTHTDSVSLGMQPAMAETQLYSVRAIHYLPLSNFLSVTFSHFLLIFLSVHLSASPHWRQFLSVASNLQQKSRSIIDSLQLQITCTGFDSMGSQNLIWAQWFIVLICFQLAWKTIQSAHLNLRESATINTQSPLNDGEEMRGPLLWAKLTLQLRRLALWVLLSLFSSSSPSLSHFLSPLFLCHSFWAPLIQFAWRGAVFRLWCLLPPLSPSFPRSPSCQELWRGKQCGPKSRSLQHWKGFIVQNLHQSH